MIKEIAKLVYTCCTAFNIQTELVCSKSKKGEASDMRKKILYYLHDDKQLSYNTLSKIFDRNPRTVRRAIEDTRNRLKYERLFRLEYETFRLIAKEATD
jgi:chromosomal replication initiation ATPase DnaA